MAGKRGRGKVPDLTTVYDRGTGNVVTIENFDGATWLSKFVNTPVSALDVSRSKYHDYYTDATNYERWEYVYDTNNFLVELIAPDSSTYQEATYNAQGNVTSLRTGTGPWEYWTYEAGGIRVASHEDTAGIEAGYEYDANDRLSKVTHPSVHANGYRYEYDTSGQLTKEISPLGTETVYTYDTHGRMTQEVRDAGGLDITTQYAYDDLGNMIEMTDPRGKVTEYEYGDPSCGACGGGGNLELVRDALNRETEWIYDSNGRLEKTIDAAGIETAYEYDTMGRLTKIVHPAGGSVEATITYDKLGRVASRTDFGGSTTSFEYDHRGRVVKETDAVGDIDYDYNSLGLLVSVTDSLGHTTTNTYDSAYRLTKVTDEIGKQTHYTYDSAGRQESVGAGTSGTVDVTTYTYDATTGLLDSVEYGSSAYTANYEYDGEARLVKLTDWLDAVDGLRYAYDDVGRLTTITDYDDSTLTYTYDDAGNVLTMNDYHGNTTSYTYNDIGQLSTITAPGSKVWSYTYDTGNRLTKVDLPNGMHTDYAYDTSGRQDAIQHKDGSTVLQGFDYTFDNGGNITRIDHEDGSYWAYDYDGRDRLVEAERYDATPTLLHRYTYTYDDGDNLLTKAVYDPSGPSTVTTTYTYNDANEQTSMSDGVTTIDMTYDDWGRLVEKDDGTYTATYAYRYGSKLYSVASNFPGEGNVTYETGGDQKRRSRVAGTNETWYNYTAGFDVVSTEDDANGSTGALTMTNVVLRPTAQVSATLGDLAGTTPATGTARYYATDHLGSTRSVWDAAKSNVGTYEFTPYGSEYNHTGAALASLAGAYTGKPWDDTAKLFHFPYRQYSPDMARWTTRDPLGMVDGPNVYAYVTGNPVMHHDPDGRVLPPIVIAGGALLLRLLPLLRRLGKLCKKAPLKVRVCKGKNKEKCKSACKDKGGVAACYEYKKKGSASWKSPAPGSKGLPGCQCKGLTY